MSLTVRFRLASVILTATFAAACGGDDQQVPAATSESQVSRQTNQPTTVTGCLRAGDAADTFVLTTTATEGDSRSVTYHLTDPGNVTLKDHIGKQVQVSGVVEAQAQIVARESAKPAENATGTAGAPGTPTVQTGTRLSVQRMDVKSIQPTGEECGAQ